jgi:hypothetical protein
MSRKVRPDYRTLVEHAFDAIPRHGEGPWAAHDVADLVAVEVPAPRQGDRWGPWVYQARTQELWHATEDYAIDLERCGSCAELLETIFHVSAKAWMTREAIGHLIQALSDLLEPCAHLCSCGADQGPFDVKHWLKTRAKVN